MKGAKEYIKDRQIAAGGFAKVYQCHTSLNPEVPLALKVIDMVENLRKVSSFKKYMDREINVMRVLDNHPNIVKLYDVFPSPEKDKLFLVMEYCAGGSLQSRLVRDNKRIKLSEKLVRHYMRQLADGLKFMYHKNIIHRDIKPANLLLLTTDDETVLKIADFGFARFFEGDRDMVSQLGTPMYMAPEIRGGSYTDKVDLWSMGVIMYQMLFGDYPFTYEHVIANARVASKTDVKIPSEPVISHEARDLLIGMLQINVKYRINWADFFSHPFLNPVDENLSQSIIAFPLLTPTANLNLNKNNNNNNNNNLCKVYFLPEFSSTEVDTTLPNNAEIPVWQYRRIILKHIPDQDVNIILLICRNGNMQQGLEMLEAEKLANYFSSKDDVYTMFVLNKELIKQKTTIYNSNNLFASEQLGFTVPSPVPSHDIVDTFKQKFNWFSTLAEAINKSCQEKYASCEKYVSERELFIAALKTLTAALMCKERESEHVLKSLQYLFFTLKSEVEKLQLDLSKAFTEMSKINVPRILSDKGTLLNCIDEKDIRSTLRACVDEQGHLENMVKKFDDTLNSIALELKKAQDCCTQKDNFPKMLVEAKQWREGVELYKNRISQRKFELQITNPDQWEIEEMEKEQNGCELAVSAARDLKTKLDIFANYCAQTSEKDEIFLDHMKNLLTLRDQQIPILTQSFQPLMQKISVQRQIITQLEEVASLPVAYRAIEKELHRRHAYETKVGMCVAKVTDHLEKLKLPAINQTETFDKQFTGLVAQLFPKFLETSTLTTVNITSSPQRPYPILESNLDNSRYDLDEFNVILTEDVDVSKLMHENATITQQLQDLREKYGKLMTSSPIMQNSQATFQHLTQLAQYKEENDMLKRNMDILTNELNTKQKELSDVQNQTKQVADLTSKISVFEILVAEKTDTIAKLTAENYRHAEALANSKAVIDELNTQIWEAERNVADKESQLSDLTVKIIENENASSQIKDQKEKLEQEKFFLTEICKNLEQEKKSAMAESENLKNILHSNAQHLEDATRAKIVLQDELENTVTTNQNLVDEKLEIDSELMATKAKVESLDAKIALLEDTIEAYKLQFSNEMAPGHP